MTEKIVNVEVIHFADQLKSFEYHQKKDNLEDFIKDCENKDNFYKTTESITIAPPKYFNSIEASVIYIKGKLSYSITNDAILKIIEQTIRLILDPFDIAKLLKDLDIELGEAMQANGIDLHQNKAPKNLIAALGHFTAGPPPQNYVPLKKSRMLSKILLKHEKAMGINIDDYVPKFVGLVPAELGDEIINKGHIFSEQQQVRRTLFHGSYTHRLLLHALFKAIKEKLIDLKISKDCELTEKQFLEFLVNVYYYHGFFDTSSMWQMTIDTTSDQSDSSSDKPYDPKLFTFSFRSPFSMQSTLIGFGNELELPNLQMYLLDNHYKEMFKMMFRAKKAIGELQGIPYFSVALSDEQLYLMCVNKMSVHRNNLFGVILPKNFFTLSPKELLQNPNYEIIHQGVAKRKTEPEYGIVKRKMDTEFGTYKNMIEFYKTQENSFSLQFFNKKEIVRELSKEEIKENKKNLAQ